MVIRQVFQLCGAQEEFSFGRKVLTYFTRAPSPPPPTTQKNKTNETKQKLLIFNCESSIVFKSRTQWQYIIK